MYFLFAFYAHFCILLEIDFQPHICEYISAEEDSGGVNQQSHKATDQLATTFSREK